MPIKGKKTRQAYYRDRHRRLRESERRERESESSESYPRVPDDPVQQVKLLRAWSMQLRTPPGHPRAGKPLTLPDYACEFLERALSVPESGLIIARKNAKSSILALLCLACLDGPLKAPSWRGAIVSLSLPKARELLTLASQIVRANELDLRIKKTPYPGVILNDRTGGALECLSADKHSGHAGGYDLVCCDETGLMDAVRHRELLAGLHSSLSARNGRLVHITIRGDCELVEELIERSERTPETTYVRVYEAPTDCSISDRAAWHAANPGLKAGIKSLQYMQDRAVQVANSPDDELHYRAHDLNQKQAPGRQMLCSVSEWQRVERDELPARSGPCFAGVDLGGSRSMCCVSVYWPETGRLEVQGAYPYSPGLKERGAMDGCGRAYLAMQDEGSLYLMGERVTDAAAFLRTCFEDLAGCNLVALGADRYRRSELESVLEEIQYYPNVIWRGTGAGRVADGSADVRAFRRAIMSERIRVLPLTIWRSALRYGEVRHDAAGNPALNKTKYRGRIDALQASVIAIGLSALAGAQKPRRFPRFAV
ncbi:MAG: hypothetical protein F4103_19600 [Boseongicola sp. SB0673_bin_14]|nr:hypothetical protein [Boseongicola sp. SB0673_bin_14]